MPVKCSLLDGSSVRRKEVCIMFKKMLSLIVVPSVCTFITTFVWAQVKYPEKPIQAIVGYAAGAGADAAARVVAESLGKYLGQPVIIVNKPGGGGSLGGNALVSSKPDGYTVGVFSPLQPTPEYFMNPERFTYKFKDIQSVAQCSFFVPAAFVRYDSPWKSTMEFVEYIKANPNKVKFGHNGRGSMYWLIGAMFAEQYGLKMLDVAFQGDGQNLAALLGNHTDMAIMGTNAGNVGQIKGNKIRPLFLFSQKRYYLLPEVPTTEEVGIQLKLPEAYFGIFAPKMIPKEVVSKLSEAARKVTEDPQFKENMQKIWFPVLYRDTRDFEEYVETFGKTQWKYLRQLGVL
jgi:tripartite-type tricarboxylate transporter receptor subunit TctC